MLRSVSYAANSITFFEKGSSIFSISSPFLRTRYISCSDMAGNFTANTLDTDCQDFAALLGLFMY